MHVIDGTSHLMARDVQLQQLHVEGIFYMKSTAEYPQRHRHIEGYCDQIPKGHIRVGFWIGKCTVHNMGESWTGYQSISRIVIEEVPPPQQ